MQIKTIKVFYTGRPSQITTDYNGKRYVFSRRNPIVNIPVEVYNHVERNLMFADMIAPYEEPEEIIETHSHGNLENTTITHKKKAGRPKGRKNV